MMTPRPDRFTYPADQRRRGLLLLSTPWIGAVFLVGVFGCVALAAVLA
jgi:hypothetical protein